MILAITKWRASEEMIVLMVACNQDGGVNDTRHQMPALQYLICSTNPRFSATTILKIIASSKELQLVYKKDKTYRLCLNEPVNEHFVEIYYSSYN
jgi:hypothetical protein